MAGKNLFNSVQIQRPDSNHFDLTHENKLSMQMGQLIPVMCMEALPGDKFSIAHETLIRLAPMVFPVMHRLDATIHTFFVPNRLVWGGWEDFITDGGSNWPQVIPPTHPFMGMSDGAADPGTLANYLGCPQQINPTAYNVNPIPFAAYQIIYNEYYRDQNLISKVDYPLLQGDNTFKRDTQLNIIRRRAWEHDYFTSALPFAQKGAAVDIPLGDITLNPAWSNPLGLAPTFRKSNGDVDTGAVQNANAGLPDVGFISVAGNAVAYDPDGSLQVQSTTINDLRSAFRLQEWLEKNARGGTRYIENILVHFGVKSSDARLNRPEYITGSKSPVIISEVLNTTGTNTLPQGNMAGHGISVTSGVSGSYHCEEHGYIISIMSVMPKTAYQQGLPRHFSKNDKLDYYWPAFANLGEQEILNKELYIESAQPDATFGYIPRYSEYKYMPSRVSGQFQTTLADWHMARIFDPLAPPALNQNFVDADPTLRIFAVTTPIDDQLFCSVLNKVHAVRKMPVYGTPTF